MSLQGEPMAISGDVQGVECGEFPTQPLSLLANMRSGHLGVVPHRWERPAVLFILGMFTR